MAPGIMCWGKKGSDSGSKRNEEIEKRLRADKKKASKEIKILLLGMSPLDPEKPTDHAGHRRR